MNPHDNDSDIGYCDEEWNETPITKIVKESKNLNIDEEYQNK